MELFVSTALGGSIENKTSIRALSRRSLRFGILWSSWSWSWSWSFARSFLCAAVCGHVIRSCLVHFVVVRIYETLASSVHSRALGRLYSLVLACSRFCTYSCSCCATLPSGNFRYPGLCDHPPNFVNFPKHTLLQSEQRTRLLSNVEFGIAKEHQEGACVVASYNALPPIYVPRVAQDVSPLRLKVVVRRTSHQRVGMMYSGKGAFETKSCGCSDGSDSDGQP